MNGASWKRVPIGGQLPVGNPMYGPWALQMFNEELFSGLLV